MKYLTDGKRHLVCQPYSKANLHKMAEDLGIKRHFFHKNRYDIPFRRKEEIEEKCELITTKELIKVINNVSDRDSLV